MASFTKTIPAGKTKAEMDALLVGCNHFLPLAQIPTRAQAGDFIYLIYRGRISARARIRALEVVKRGVMGKKGWGRNGHGAWCTTLASGRSQAGRSRRKVTRVCATWMCKGWRIWMGRIGERQGFGWLW